MNIIKATKVITKNNLDISKKKLSSLFTSLFRVDASDRVFAALPKKTFFSDFHSSNKFSISMVFVFLVL